MCDSPSGKPVAPSMSSCASGGAARSCAKAPAVGKRCPTPSLPIIQRRTRNAYAGSYWLPPKGPGNENPFSSPAPRSARSLSHGQVVCTYSLDTIRSTTLTRETVTATWTTAATRRDISLRCKKNYSFYVPGLKAPRRDSTRPQHPVMLESPGQAPAVDCLQEHDLRARNGWLSRRPRKAH